jgi:hypothetical protein
VRGDLTTEPTMGPLHPNRPVLRFPRGVVAESALLEVTQQIRTSFRPSLSLTRLYDPGS